MQETWIQSLGKEDPLEEEMTPTLIFLPGKSHGQRNLAGYSLWDCKESDTTEQPNMLLVTTTTEGLAHRTVTSLGLSVLCCEMGVKSR